MLNQTSIILFQLNEKKNVIRSKLKSMKKERLGNNSETQNFHYNIKTRQWSFMW